MPQFDMGSNRFNWELIIDGRETEILENLTFAEAQLVGKAAGQAPVGYTLRQLHPHSVVLKQMVDAAKGK